MSSTLLSFKAAFSDLLDVTAGEDATTPRITLKQLSYFVSAAQHQSVARAAATLNVSPPAISGAVAYLESVLGRQLFVRRHARGLLLTEAGHHLLLDARDIIGRVREVAIGFISDVLATLRLTSFHRWCAATRKPIRRSTSAGTPASMSI
jgi:hypothetical protein